MTRYAVVAGPDPGHAFPAIAVAVALRGRGHDVLFVTGTQWQAVVEAEGMVYGPIGVLPPDERHEDFGFRLWEQGRLMAPGVATVLGGFRPELVVVDTLSIPGTFAADLLELPWVELQPHTFTHQSRALPPWGAGMTPGRTPIGRARDAFLRRMHARSMAAADEQRAAARRAIGLSADPAPPVARLIATVPAMEPARPDWPADTHLVGSLEWEPRLGLLVLPPGDDPLVLVSDSTAGGARQTLLAAALEALPGAGFRVVGTRLAPYDGVVPPGAVVGSGEQLPLLAETAAVVCTGGHGLVAKALTRGVPLVVVPGPGDQRENAARASRLGAAAVLPPARLSPQRLRDAVRRVVADPGYAAAARRIAETGRGLGAERAAELVEEALAVSAAR